MAGPSDLLVQVPVGGLNDEIDEWLLEPPNAAEAQNLSSDKVGSLTKIRGYRNLNVSAPDNAILAGGREEALLMGPSPPRVLTSSGNTVTSPGASYPLSVSLRRIVAGRGFIRDVQVATAGGETAVVWSVLSDNDDVSTPDPQMIYNFRVEAVILDSNFEVIWGPTKLGDLRWLPRVEPITASGSNNVPVFCVFGVTETARNSDQDSPFATGVSLDYLRIESATASPGSQSSIGTLFPTTDIAGGADKIFKLYDTVSDADNDVCYVAAPFDNTGKELRTLQVTESSSNLSTQTLTATDHDHMAIWHDSTSDTLLVYDRGDSKVWYQQASTLGSFSSIASPSLEGIDSAASHLLGLQEGDRPHTPEFYRDEDGLAHLNTRQLILTGSGPGTPSFATESSAWLPHAYTPTPVGDRLQGFYGGLGISTVGYTTFVQYMRGAGTLEVYHMENHGDDDRPTIDVPLLESRLGDHNHRLYIYNSWASTDPEDEVNSELPCITGQTVTINDEVLLGSAFLLSQQRNRNSARIAGQIGTADNAIARNTNASIVGDVTDGAGYFNDEQCVGLCGVKVRGPGDDLSVVDVGQTTIIAAGMVNSWADNQVTPAYLRPPSIYNYVDADISKTGSRAVRIDDVPHDVDGAPFHDYDAAFRCAAVLVATAPDGRETRSPPSAFFAVGTGPTGSGGVSSSATDVPDQLPVVEIEIHPSMYSFISSGRTLDVELYVTERAVADSTGYDARSVDESTATMVCRMPIQQDDSGFFIFDTLGDFAVRNDIADDPSMWRSPPFNNALYTSTGEVSASALPAMGVMAQAGEYLFGVPSEDDNELWVSKPLVIGRTPEFSPLLVQQAPPSGGGIVSIAGLYDRLVVLCRNGVWELPVLGGPNALGEGAFPPYRLVYRGEACVGHNGTVETPDGVFYVTDSGPRFYGGGEDTDVGRAVADRLVWSALSGSAYLPSDDSVVWGSASAMVVFREGQWTTTTLGSSSLARLGNEVVRVSGSDTLLSDSDEITDASTASPYLAKWESPWLKTRGLTMDNRHRKIGLLMRLENSPTYGSIEIKLRYDYDDTVRDTKTFTAAEFAAQAPLLQVTPAYKQQATAIKISIEDVTEQVILNPGPEQTIENRNDIKWTLAGVEMNVLPKLGLADIQSGAKR